MVGSIVWCMLLVNLGTEWENEVSETAIRGEVVASVGETLTVDFREYAKLKNYGAYIAGPTDVPSFMCVREL